VRSGRPNIVFILLDTFRADYLTRFGGAPALKTLEDIAKKGTVYMHAIAPGTYTAPSHMSFFLGKRPLSGKRLLRGHKTNTESPIKRYVDKGELTLASKLEYLGYDTSLFSSNAFLDPSIDLTNGFSYIQGNLVKTTHRYFDIASKVLYSKAVRNGIISSIDLLSHLLSRQQLDRLFLSSIKMLGNHLNKEYGYYSLDRGASTLNSNINEYLKGAGASNKFMFINYMEAHEGYPTQLITKDYVEQDRWLYMSHILDPEPVKIIRKACGKRLEYLDKKIEELLHILARRGVLDNATLILASDHGQAFMEHDQMYHFVFPYEQLAHVPLIIARFRNGKQISERNQIGGNFSLTQLYDMIANMAYGTEGQVIGNNDYVFCDHIGILNWWATRIFEMLRNKSNHFNSIYKTLKSFDTNVTAIYHKNYKLIHFYDSPERDELYDLSEDRGESKNIIGGKRQLALQMLKANMAQLGKR
jgi:membrane-anchored protein YejM (alkaline phosphatase superfamily)